MKPNTRYRPRFCPRCNRRVEDQRPTEVWISDTHSGTFVRCESSFPKMDMTLTTETWITYRPCGCEVPPEEHNEAVR